MIDKALIKKLSSAGVDPAVIINLIVEDEAPEAAQDPAPVPDPQPAAPAAAPDPQPVPAANNDAVLAAIEKLTGVIQASNIRGASAGDPQGSETADTILANLLHPQPKT